MQLTSFWLQRNHRPMHTPDRMLNVFLACRMPPRRPSPSFVSVLMHGLLRACRKVIQRSPR